MKMLVEERTGEGLESLLGKNIMVWCMNYIYAGKLVGVNDNDIKLTEAKVVYETGQLCAKTWKDAQKLPSDLFVRTSAIECYCESGRD
jgi:hypothetical protein